MPPPRRRQPKEDFGLPVTYGSITLKTMTDFVVLVENQLGCLPKTDEKTPLWKARGIEVAKLRRKIATQPNLYTWKNLIIALNYCQRHKIRVQTPAGVCWKVEAALRDMGPEKPLSDVAERIQKAIAWEQARALADREHWLTLLSRAGGSAREDVLMEWREARFGVR